ncbi:MAG: hypothetical protein MI725_02215 [Pirellulales bacterium]|nr:hypothetical protein [Pirellulales bacterium]
MKKLGNPFRNFWFEDAPASRLATLRILVGTFAIWYLSQRVDMFTDLAAETEHSLFAPVGVAAWLDAPINANLYHAIVIFNLVLNVLFVFGCFHRITGPLFAATLMFTLCYRNSWSMIYHSDNAMVFHVLVLGLTPAADAFSVDAWRRRAKNLTPTRNLAGSWQFGWPIRLMCAVTLVTYFLAGVAKVAGPLGWSWAGGEALRSQIAVDALRKELLSSGGPELAFALYDQVWLFTALGVGTFVLELGAPLALLNKRLAQFWAINAFFMHWGIYFIMDINFRYCLTGVIFATFFAVERPFLAFGRAFRSTRIAETKSVVAADT